MTMKTEFTDRVANSFLVPLTNIGDTTATTVNDTVLDAGIADMQIDFKVETGITFDESLASHISAGIDGILWQLHRYTGMEAARSESIRQRWERSLSRIAAIGDGTNEGADSRIMPSTTSVKKASTPVNDRLPAGDPQRWADYTFRLPVGPETDDVDC